MTEIKFDATKVDLQNSKPSYTFFEWWEDFTELAYSKNLIITESKDVIRDKWYNKENYNIEDAIKSFTR